MSYELGMAVAEHERNHLDWSSAYFFAFRCSDDCCHRLADVYFVRSPVDTLVGARTMGDYTFKLDLFNARGWRWIIFLHGTWLHYL